MLTRHQLEASRARADAATKGPWRAGICVGVCNADHSPHLGPPECIYEKRFYEREGDSFSGVSNDSFDDVVSAYYDGLAISEPDNHFIAHARADLPAALDALEEVMGALREHLAATIVFAAVAREGHLLNEEQTGIRGDVEEHRRTMVRLRALLTAYDADAPTWVGDGGEG